MNDYYGCSDKEISENNKKTLKMIAIVGIPLWISLAAFIIVLIAQLFE